MPNEDRFRELQRAREAYAERVELDPRPAVVHVTPFCGPDGDLVMVNVYGMTHFTTREASELAAAVGRAADITANPIQP